jgi:hypothetical protein
MASRRVEPWVVVVCALIVVALAIVVIPRVISQGVTGTVTAVDTTGKATIKTEEGQEYQMQGSGWQVGDKVECDTKDGQVMCEKS